MIHYHSLRQVTIALRAATTLLLRLKGSVDVIAEGAAARAKKAGLLSIQSKEDKAFARVMQTKAETDEVCEAAEQAILHLYDQRELIEDEAEEQYLSVCKATGTLRARLEEEVL